jgi:hypothetical protein
MLEPNVTAAADPKVAPKKRAPVAMAPIFFRFTIGLPPFFSV